MTVDRIVNAYQAATPVCYDESYIRQQIDFLVQAKPKDMEQIKILLSALKYYISISWETYQEIIFFIVNSIENIYNISGLLEEILSVTE